VDSGQWVVDSGSQPTTRATLRARIGVREARETQRAGTAIRIALGTDDETEIRLRFVELHHGRDLANAVRLRLQGPRE
jgi:hypothetical protein